MDLHPYDGVERRFRDDDADPTDGRAIVARVLRREELPGLRYDVQWLVGDWSLAQFVDEHRADFQPPLADEALAWFVPESGVNHWELLYEAGGAVHYIAFDQG